MLNLNNVLVLTKEQNDIIKGFGKLTAEHWRRNQTKLSKAIRNELKKKQKNHCVYCGCIVWGSGDVEHIVHKASYPQFLFTPQNLAYSCKTCNQIYKGSKDIVTVKGTSYNTYQFKIVHPYIDDVDHFFDTKKVRIQIKPGLNAQEAEKAKNTCRLLHWDDPEVVSRRAMETMSGMYMEEHGLKFDEKTIDDILVYRPLIT